MVGMFERLERSFLESPIVYREGYPYFVNPISDGIPRIDRELMEEFTDGIVNMCDLECDLVLAPESMGIPIATCITMRTGIPFSVIRKRGYDLPGEIRLDQTTGYSRSPMYINGLSRGDRVVIVDDVVSTGGTLISIRNALESAGVELTEIAVVFNKCDDITSLESELGVPIRYLIKVGVKDGSPVMS